MEIYSAKVRIVPPGNSSYKLLDACVGEKFFILWKRSGPWWGGMSCKSHEVGYIPCRYLEFSERLDAEKTREAQLLIAEMLDKRRSVNTHTIITKHYDENISPDIPDADYDDEDDNGDSDQDDETDAHSRNGHIATRGGYAPNPAKKELHKELMINMKGGNPILKKTELQKELERRALARQRREFEEYRISQRTSLEVKLAERHAMMTKMEEEELRAASQESSMSELERVQERIRRRTQERIIPEDS